jgi:uncharacterized protein YukE
MSADQAPSGYSVNTEALHTIANRLTDEAKEVHECAKLMRKATLESVTGTNAMAGFGTAPSPTALAKKAHDLIYELASACSQLGDTMGDAANQLHKAGNIYAITDKDHADKLKKTAH